MADEKIQPEVPVVGEATVPLSDPPDVAVPWTGPTLLLVWLLGAASVAVAGGLFAAVARRLYDPPPASEWISLLASVTMLPVQVAVGVLLVKEATDASLADMGLTGRRLLHDVALGLAFVIPLTLVVYGVNVGCETLMRELGAGVPQEHAFTKLARQGITPAQWVLVILSAVVVAAVWEEFLFRGLAQPWAMAKPWGGWAMLGMAGVLTALVCVPKLKTEEALAVNVVAGMPLMVLMVLIAAYALLERRWPMAARLFATAVLFGWLHVAVWPSPVALTVLGVGLGAMRWWTKSLAGPITMHAAFNVVAVVGLVLELKKG